MMSGNFEQQLQLGDYSSGHRILFVGEGSFAFSSILATAFITAPNIFATSIDTYETFYTRYGAEGDARIKNLRARGAQVFFGLDITATAAEIPSDSKVRPLLAMKFDRIIFNYPHAGYPRGQQWLIGAFYDTSHHQDLMRSFFDNVSQTMLRSSGEIHVTHKATVYKRWKFNRWAKICGLYLKKSLLFVPHSFPGYMPCRGAGNNWIATFPLGKCRTYVYGIDFQSN